MQNNCHCFEICFIFVSWLASQIYKCSSLLVWFFFHLCVFTLVLPYIYNIYYIFIAIAHCNPIVYSEYSSVVMLLLLVFFCFIYTKPYFTHFHVLFPHNFSFCVAHTDCNATLTLTALHHSKMRKASFFHHLFHLYTSLSMTL